MLQKLPYHDLAYGHTHMFEIIYPENRIVVDYGAQEKLVLLGVMHTSGGTEIPHKNLEEHLRDSFELVKAYHSENGWEHLKSLNEPNKEGFVIRFNSGFRMKIKFEDYVRLHRIITQVSNIDIWERLMKDEPLDDILEKVPDEFFDWVRQWEKALKFGYVTQEKEARKWFDRLNEEIVFAERKEQAIWILGFVPQEYQSIMFNMLDGRDYSQAIWKMLRPEWSKPFANSEN